MIYAMGTPINARFRPWVFDWTIKPDALMISAIDFIKSPSTFKKMKEKGIHEILNWDGQIICDSGAFSAINRKKKVDLSVDKVSEIYKEITSQDPNVIKITLDYPDEKILDNYKALSSLEVQPVVPQDRFQLFNEILKTNGIPEWLFIGRLVPLMRRGGGHANRLFPVLDRIKGFIHSLKDGKEIKLWALGVGAPSLILEMIKKVDGCDSARWRVTGSNMILLPKGGERGVANRTKWRGTHHRINDGLEKTTVVKILRQIDKKSGGLENLDNSLHKNLKPKQLRDKVESDLPTVGQLLNKLRNNTKSVTVYDLELLFRSSGNLRLLFNYWAALSFKTHLRNTMNKGESKQLTLDTIL